MQIKSVKTRIARPPQDDLFLLLSESLYNFKEKNILVITSKVVSIHQGKCVKIINNKNQKKDLVLTQADKFIDIKNTPNRKYSFITLKQNIVIGQAGIDESNGDGYYILWPDKPQEFVKKIYDYLQDRFKIKNFGVIIADSRSQPFRLGVTGFSLVHYGFQALKKYHGKQDIFGRDFKSERVNVADSLATAAGFVMGEGNEQTPLAVISDLPEMEFGDFSQPPVGDLSEDQYLGLINNDLWRSNK